MIGYASNVGQDAGHGFLTARVGIGSLSLKQAAKPTTDSVNRLKIFVVLCRVAARSTVPIGIREKRIAKHTRVAQAQRHTLSESGVADSGGFAD